jgi:hypothetical protein
MEDLFNSDDQGPDDSGIDDQRDDDDYEVEIVAPLAKGKGRAKGVGTSTKRTREALESPPPSEEVSKKEKKAPRIVPGGRDYIAMTVNEETVITAKVMPEVAGQVRCS